MKNLLKKIRKLYKLSYYYELYKEKYNSFRYPQNILNKTTLNIIKLNQIKKLLRNSKRLHLGCGGTRMDGFINIDAFKTEAVDFVCKIEELPKYMKPDTIEMIYSSHTLEHFSIKDAEQVLKMYYSFLKPGGEFRLSIPDLMKLAGLIESQKLSKEQMRTVQGVLLGSQDTRYDYHKSIYWFDLLKSILEKIGFVNIEEYQCYPHFLEGVKDASSMAGKPDLGIYISLNVKAVK